MGSTSFEVEVTDPTDGTVHTFTGDTQTEAEENADHYFNNETADDPRLVAAREHQEATAAVYAGTPDGMAETQRLVELTPRNSLDYERFATRLTKGRQTAAAEYLARLDNDPDRPADGPLEPLPLPSTNDPITEFLIAHRVMGTYRSTEKSVLDSATAVTLLWLDPTNTRQRVTASIPQTLTPGDDTTLTDVIMQAPTAKLQSLVGADMAAELRTAIEQARSHENEYTSE